MSTIMGHKYHVLIVLVTFFLSSYAYQGRNVTSDPKMPINSTTNTTSLLWPWFENQWENPTDIMTVLLIIGGDITQQALAQLAGGTFVPIAFSFGHVAYSFISIQSILGEGRLMPASDCPSKVINATGGSTRTNGSWILGRLLRDMEVQLDKNPRLKESSLCISVYKAYLLPQEKRSITSSFSLPQTAESKPRNFDLPMPNRYTDHVKELCQKIRDLSKQSYLKEEEISTIIQRNKSLEASRYKLAQLRHQTVPRDLFWWSCFAIIVVQLLLATIPLVLYQNPLILLYTAWGTILAWASAALPQWTQEKYNCRPQSHGQYCLTRGNGNKHVVLIQNTDYCMNLEDLASSRACPTWFTYIATLLIFLGAVAMLVGVSGLKQNSWFLLSIGFLGMLQNIIIAGAKRNPSAYGFHLELVEHFYTGRVLDVLKEVEVAYPKVGVTLLREFFNGHDNRLDPDWWQERTNLQKEHGTVRKPDSKDEKNTEVTITTS